jgi:hypothetical protein
MEFANCSALAPAGRHLVVNSSLARRHADILVARIQQDQAVEVISTERAAHLARINSLARSLTPLRRDALAIWRLRPG